MQSQRMLAVQAYPTTAAAARAGAPLPAPHRQMIYASCAQTASKEAWLAALTARQLAYCLHPAVPGHAGATGKIQAHTELS